MGSELGRRAFLQQNIAAGLVLGLPLLRATAGPSLAKVGPPPISGAELLDQARKRMKDELRPGVVLVIPTDPGRVGSLTNALGRLMAPPDGCDVPAAPVKAVKTPEKKAVAAVCGATDPALQRLFCEAVFACVPVDDVRAAYADVRADAALVLLDAQGKFLADLPYAPGLFEKDFVTRLTEFVHGPEGKHLASAARAQRAALGEAKSAALDRSLADLDSDDFSQREQASRHLGGLAPRAPAVLVRGIQDVSTLEARYRLERIFSARFAALADCPGDRLPYGVRFEAVAVHSCPGCGMAILPQSSRQFVRFLATKAVPKK